MAFCKNILLLFILAGGIASCKGKMYRASSNSMAGTIWSGEPIYVKETSNISRNDIAVFDYYGLDYSNFNPESNTINYSWQKRIYRVAAMSGDIVRLQDYALYVNEKPVPLPPAALRPYGLYCKVPLDDYIDEKDKLYIQTEMAGDTTVYKLFLSEKKAMHYKETIPEIIKVAPVVIDFGSTAPDTSFARPSSSVSWTDADYGPLKIPSPGDTVFVTAENQKLYSQIPGIRQGSNIISEKLFFMLGDNRRMAEDSRFIGFVPLSKIYGVVK